MSAGESKPAGSESPEDEVPARAATTEPAPPMAAENKPLALPGPGSMAPKRPAPASETPAVAATAPDVQTPSEVATSVAPEETAAASEPPVAASSEPAAPASSEPATTPVAAEKADAVAAIEAAPPTTTEPAPAGASQSATEPPSDEPVTTSSDVDEPSGNDASTHGPSPRALDNTPGIHVHLYGQTDVGLVREHNEDNFLLVDLSTNVRGIDERLLRHTIGARGSLFVVCDGMGGAAAGEIASQMAVDTLHDIMTTGGTPDNRDHFARRLVHAVEEAGSRIFSSAKMDRTRRGMGTTSTVAGVVDKILFVGQVGDSRAYALRGGKDFALITKDQSLVNQLIEAGQLTEEEAEAFEHSNIILQALGTAESVTVDLTFLELKQGDRVMLCSDGLSGLVHAEMIKDVLANVGDPRACCATLIEMARAGGGHDNITVIVADFSGADLAPPDDASRVAYQQYPLPDSTDARDSLPARDTGIKSGGPKPGSDVKGDPYARKRSEGEGSNLGILVGVLLLLAIVAAIAYAVMGGGGGGGSDSSSDGTSDGTAPIAVPGEGDAPPVPVEVQIVSDVRHGDLWIDGERRVSLNPGGRTVVELPPGAYSLEARTTEGAIAATASLTVVAGQPMDLALNVPAGSEDEDPPGVGGPIGGPAAVLDGGADASVEPTAMPTPPETDAPDAGRPQARREDGGPRRRVVVPVEPASSGPPSDGTPPRPPPGPVPENPFGK